MNLSKHSRAIRGVSRSTGRELQGRFELEAPQEWDPAAFERRLVSRNRLKPQSAANIRRLILNMTADAGFESPSTFMKHPAEVIKQIKMPPRNRTRGSRYLAVDHFLRAEEGFDPSGATACREAILAAFPGRTAENRNLLDIQFGGSTKLARDRAPFTLVHAATLIATTAAVARPNRRLRDTALVAMHVFSGIPPAYLPELRWEHLEQLLRAEPRETDRFDFQIRGVSYPLAIHEQATDRLRTLWNSDFCPRTGPVFTKLTEPHQALGRGIIGDMLPRYLKASGLPPVDQRLLRAPFMLWMQQRGLDLYKLSQAFGYLRSSHAKVLLGIAEASQAQRQASEIAPIFDSPLPARTVPTQQEDPVRLPTLLPPESEAISEGRMAR